MASGHEWPGGCRQHRLRHRSGWPSQGSGQPSPRLCLALERTTHRTACASGRSPYSLPSGPRPYQAWPFSGWRQPHLLQLVALLGCFLVASWLLYRHLVPHPPAFGAAPPALDAAPLRHLVPHLCGALPLKARHLLPHFGRRRTRHLAPTRIGFVPAGVLRRGE